MAEPELRTLAERFRTFGLRECRHSSPLYERLSLGVAEDADLLSLLVAASPGQRRPNLLLAAVHYLLLRGDADPLADFYPSVSESPRSPDEAFPVFRRFALDRADEISGLIATRRTQTNEVARSAFLLPAFDLAARAADRPLALIEVGAAAGLNLLFDRYRYRYGNDRWVGTGGPRSGASSGVPMLHPCPRPSRRSLGA
jgi:hypothetical protein